MAASGPSPRSVIHKLWLNLSSRVVWRDNYINLEVFGPLVHQDFILYPHSGEQLYQNTHNNGNGDGVQGFCVMGGKVTHDQDVLVTTMSTVKEERS